LPTPEPEEPDPLAADQRQQRVEDREAGVEPRPQPAARGGRGRGRAKAARRAAAGQRPAVQRPAEAVDHAAEPAVMRRDRRRRLELGQRADAESVEPALGQRHRALRPEPHDLAAEAAFEPDPVADRGAGGEAGDGDQPAAERRHPAEAPHRVERGDPCGDRFDLKHSVLASGPGMGP